MQLNELCHSYLDEPCEPWGDRHLDEIKSIRTGDRIPFQSTYLGKYNLGGLYLRVKLKCTGIQTTLSGNRIETRSRGRQTRRAPCLAPSQARSSQPSMSTPLCRQACRTISPAALASSAAS